MTEDRYQRAKKNRTLLVAIIFVLIVLLVSLCVPKGSGSDSLGELIKEASKDNIIDAEDYRRIDSATQASSDVDLQEIRNADDENRIRLIKDYVQRQWTKYQMSGVEWQASGKPFNVNVYFERSGSMEAYCKEANDMGTAMYQLLANIENANLTGDTVKMAESINLHHLINSSVSTISLNADMPSMEKFCDLRTLFQARRRINTKKESNQVSDGATSDLTDIFKTILQNVDRRNVAIFVSDCILSLQGGGETRAQLEFKGSVIKSLFTNKLNSLDMASVVLQMQSPFTGKYYDYENRRIVLQGLSRPYYIWLFGHRDQIEQLNNNAVFRALKGQERLMVFSLPKSTDRYEYQILTDRIVGRFSRGGLRRNHIENAVPEGTNRFGFDVAVRFGKSLFDPQFYLDASNYSWTDSSYTVTPTVLNNRYDSSLKRFNYRLTLRTQDLTKCNDNMTLGISVRPQIPAWADSMNTDDDSRIKSDVTQRYKTFGLKTLLSSIFGAYHDKSLKHEIPSITIKILKKKS